VLQPPLEKHARRPKTERRQQSEQRRLDWHPAILQELILNG
jgi:hypothetical protein